MKTKCWKCHGRGWLYNHLLGVASLGYNYLIQAIMGKERQHPEDICPICHGQGWIE